MITAANNDAAILSDICLSLSSLRDVTILNSIIKSLRNIADGAEENNPLVVSEDWTPCGDFLDLTDSQYEILTYAQFEALATDCILPLVTVQFFTDSGRTNQLFSVNTVDNPTYFIVAKGKRLLFVPPQSLINDDGDGMNLPTYYVTITISTDPVQVIQKTYSNAANLLFASVIVATKSNPEFTTAGSTCIVVPGKQTQENLPISDQLGYLIQTYDLYIQLPVFNWEHLSEQARVIAGMNANNLVRLALYADKYRNGKATFYSADVDGTFVGQIELLPSKDVLRGRISVRCASYASNSSY